MKIKCVITDDEPLARKGLREYIEKVDILELAGECKNAIELNNLLQTTKVDLLFLDIEMPYLSGLDFLANMENPPLTVITSAYEKYALKSYEFHVSDYLLKPISFARFMKAINNIQVTMEKAGKEIVYREHGKLCHYKYAVIERYSQYPFKTIWGHITAKFIYAGTSFLYR